MTDLNDVIQKLRRAEIELACAPVSEDPYYEGLADGRAEGGDMLGPIIRDLEALRDEQQEILSSYHGPTPDENWRD